jgi:hypothetical protein
MKPQALITPMVQADQDRGTQARLLHSYSEARQILGDVPVSTWSMWIAQGLVVPVRIGPRRCFIRHEDVVKLAQGVTLPKG